MATSSSITGGSRPPRRADRPTLAARQRFLANARRRTEIRRRAAERRAREEFLALVTHELKTPLTVMQAYLELLLKRAERAGRTSEAELVRRVADQASQMLNLVEQLLDLQRLNAERLPLALSRFDLASLARQVAEGIQLAAPTHRLHVQSDGPVVVLADRARIAEVLQNLLGNAVKYSPAGSEITVSLGREGDRAVLAVRDRGAGIPAAEQERVFDRYYRGSQGADYHKGHRGLGLGLYIARELVRRHGGDIRLESAPGAGSTFEVHLPREGPADAAD